MEHIAYYLRDIYFNKKTGPLIFKHEGIRKYLFFHDGYLVFAKITHPQELLGEILVKLGKISKKTYSKIDQFIEPMHRLGEILIKEGLLTENDLYEGLEHQMREITLNIFPFFGGRFKFQERRRFIEEEFKSKISIPDLVEEGIRRMEYSPQLEKFMKNKIPFPKDKDFIDRLSNEEKEIFEMIDGISSAEALLNSSDFSREIFWKCLYLLYCLNIIDVKDVERASVKEVAYQDSEKRLAEVMVLRERFSTMDYYQILGVPKDASPYEIKTAYFHLVRKYHPDSFDKDLPPDIKEKIEDVFRQITEVYSTLGNEEKREDYDSKSDNSAELDRPDRIDLQKDADDKFHQGKSLYDQGKYEEAAALLEDAVTLRNNKGSYFLLLAKAESKVPQFQKRAEDNFLKAIKMEPWDSEGHVGLGQFYKQEGLLTKAKKQFERALEIDREHKVALEELNLIEKSEKKKGLKKIFSSELFGKK